MSAIISTLGISFHDNWNYILVSSLGSLHNTFQCYKSQSSGRRLVDQIQLESSKSSAQVHYVFNYINLPSTTEVAYIVCGIS